MRRDRVGLEQIATTIFFSTSRSSASSVHPTGSVSIEANRAPVSASTSSGFIVIFQFGGSELGCSIVKPVDELSGYG
uniref:Uncharacterized protein n=1 Tax=Klebsiella pneumoniae TaxID=573 RepID=A0A8B0SVN1_KLEPN|nr:hypothetical protein [Klebsiella pneumoniae]